MRIASALFPLLLSLSAPAFATWTIVAVDPHSREVGSAGASCTPFVAGVARLVPGHGAIVAQAMSNMEAKRDGAEMIAAGRRADAIVASISDPAYDREAALQQYGVAVLNADGTAGVAAFTGSATPESRGHIIGPNFTVQGNILVSDRVLRASFEAFRAAEARRLPLAERLLLALEAGSAAGGDSRCGSKTAQSAYLGVAAPEDPASAPRVRIIVSTSLEESDNPVAEVRRRFDASRRAAR